MWSLVTAKGAGMLRELRALALASPMLACSSHSLTLKTPGGASVCRDRRGEVVDLDGAGAEPHCQTTRSTTQTDDESGLDRIGST